MAQETISSDYPTYTVRISPSADWNYETTLIVRRPFYDVRSPFGRATRGYLAYDKAYDEFRFFKDSWRLDLPDSDDGLVDNGLSEDEFYVEAQTIGDPGLKLPEVYHAGDVTYVNRDLHRAPSLETHGQRKGADQIHHRILQELLCPLSSFHSSKELVWVTLDVLKTMKVVHNTLNLLHKDISVGNVMMRVNDNGETEGILNDWDNNGPPPAPNDANPRPPFKVGTRQFMSIELFSSQNGRNQLRHDIESALLWVPLYMAFQYLRYIPQTISDPNLFGQIRGDREPVPTQAQSVAMRHTYLAYATRPQFASAPLTELVFNICSVYQAFYWHTTQARRLAQVGFGTTEEFDEQMARACQRVDNIDLFIGFLEDALQKNGWLESDRAYDSVFDLGGVIAFLEDEYSLMPGFQ